VALPETDVASEPGVTIVEMHASVATWYAMLIKCRACANHKPFL